MHNLLGIETKNELPYVRLTRPLDLVTTEVAPTILDTSRPIVDTTWLTHYDSAMLDASDRGSLF
jgi:hypothetical protein